MSTRHQPDKYEAQVAEAIHQVVLPLGTRVTVKESVGEYGKGWEITPSHSKAAKVFVYGVDERTIFLTVDDLYHLELFVNKKEYQKGLPDFKRLLETIVAGRIQGWYLQGSRNIDFKRPKTLLMIKRAGSRPHYWATNILFFNKRFMKRRNVIEQSYEPY